MTFSSSNKSDWVSYHTSSNRFCNDSRSGVSPHSPHLGCLPAISPPSAWQPQALAESRYQAEHQQLAEIKGRSFLQWLKSVLVANPVPVKDEIPAQEIESIINVSCKAAVTQNITGKDLTPFLLGDILDKTSGRSLETNQALAINNIKLGIGVAKELAQSEEALA